MIFVDAGWSRVRWDGKKPVRQASSHGVLCQTGADADAVNVHRCSRCGREIRRHGTKKAREGATLRGTLSDGASGVALADLLIGCPQSVTTEIRGIIVRFVPVRAATATIQKDSVGSRGKRDRHHVFAVYSHVA